MTFFHNSIIIKYTLKLSNPMTVSNIYGQKTKYRITLELDVQDDFNPRQIDWKKVLEIQENEDLDCYIEEIDCPLNYYNWSD